MRAARLVPVHPSTVALLDVTDGRALGRVDVPGYPKKVSRHQATLHAAAGVIEVERLGAANIFISRGSDVRESLARGARAVLSANDTLELLVDDESVASTQSFAFLDDWSKEGKHKKW